MALKQCSLAVLVIATILGVYFYSLPETGTGDITVIETSDTIEQHLGKHKKLIGADYAGYRGHIYRVYTYTAYKLRDVKEVTKHHLELIQVALVYHDIGLWSHARLDYLEPSVEFMRHNIDPQRYSAQDVKLMTDIIQYHHKLTPFESDDSLRVNIVNAVRESDLVDFSLGMIKTGISSENVKKTMQTIPNQGFHATLMTIGPRYYGYNIVRIVSEISSIFRL